ncbi:MAG: cytochrome c oxidase subunit II [Opitutus sp.]|nr:cytochrome c oxidase subunit II [Opitutus sp.]
MLFAVSCTRVGPHSALEPAGTQAAHIDGLWRQLLWGCTIVYGVVMAALVLAVLKHNPAPDTQDLPEAARRRVVRIVSIAVGITILVLAWFMGATLSTERQLAQLETKNPLTVKITGRQWWWEVLYEDQTPSNQFQTANEIHVPVGRPVHLRLFSADVIHSFWVPNLHGKRDLIPGRENSLWIQADRPGVYEGQCAEFCGMQHAHMRIVVVAQPEEEFEGWLQAQRRPAPEPETETQVRGREVFLANTCVMCHTVRGTTAGSRAGPDLTHLASRRTLGAASIPNTRGHLAGWILDPQTIKPGNHMPPHTFEAEELRALLDYLESLK